MLAPLLDADGPQMLLPFAVDRVTVLRSPEAARYSHARRTGKDEFTVSLTDGTGMLCVRFDGVSLRAVPARRPRSPPSPSAAATAETRGPGSSGRSGRTPGPPRRRPRVAARC